MTRYCYFNGTIILQNKACIPVDDIGILRGYGVFDFATTYNGKPFLFKEHCERLRNSAQHLGLKVPLSNKEIERIVETLLHKNKLNNANIRIVLTGGKTLQGLSFKPQDATFFILTEDVVSIPEKLYKQGAKLMTHEHQRMFFQSKTTNYITAVSLQQLRKKKNAIEVLFTFQNNILECTTSNIFIVKNNMFITPKENILVGITRTFVIKCAQVRGYLVEERAVTIEELKNADEVFITSTNKEILPIVTINEWKIGGGTVGDHTKILMKDFRDHTNKL
ncbi:MAG: aminotransferase class IV [bacterium]|nr:aminotransferase class IV [bacterium]